MITNIGRIERTAHLVLGTVLLSLTVLGPRTWWGLVGVVPLAMGLSGVCLVRRMLGINSCPR